MAKVNFSMKCFVILASILSTHLALAYPLSTYRKQLGDPAPANAAGKARSMELRGLLGFSKLELKDPEGLFAQGLRADNGTKDLSSLLFNGFFWGPSATLKKEEWQGAPLAFDPSWGVEEARAAKQNRREAFCESKLKESMDRLMDPFLDYLTRQNQRLLSEDLAVIPSNAIEQKRTALVAKYLSDFQPRISGRSIREVLGTLVNIETVDGKAHRLIFMPSKDQGAVPLSLSMLLNFRTFRDDYFLAVLNCFAMRMKKISEDKNAPEGKKHKASLILSMGQKKLEGAWKTNSLLNSLVAVFPNGRFDFTRIDFLVDLLLQLRGEDVPTSDEMVFSDNAKEPKTIVDLFYRQLPNLDINKKVTPQRQVIERDYLYYNQLHDQLFELKNFLEEEAIKKQVIKKLVEDMS